jgi:dTDP-4-dehydrorhamnose 3,5-epimerase
MKITASTIAGVFVVETQASADDRGSFERLWCQRELEDLGLAARWVQCGLARTKLKGTLRGMHYQLAPAQENKLVACVRGAIYDVSVDIRPASRTFREFFAISLQASKNTMLYIPEGCAHGYLTLDDETEVIYHLSKCHCGELARGFRWNDPSFNIRWPNDIRMISERDRTYPDYETP